MRKIVSPDVICLKDKNVLVEPNKLSFVDPYKKIKKKEIFLNLERDSSYQKDFSVTFLPTYDCNFRCIYCYSRGGERKQESSFGTAKGILDYLSKKHSNLKIRFTGGGEPFLNFGFMKSVVEYARKRFKNVSIFVITNGSFNNEQFKWLRKNNAFVRISFDGPIQKEQRRFFDNGDTFELVKKNIKRITEAKLGNAVQSIITSRNVGRMKEIVILLTKLSVKNIKLEPAHISENTRGNKSLTPLARDYVSNFIDTLKFIRKEKLDVKLDTAFFSKPSLGHFCSMPKGNFIVTPEGYVTSCVEVSKKEEPFSRDLFWSKWDTLENTLKIDKKKLQRLREYHFLNFDKCSKCNLRFICNGGCPMRRFWEEGDQHKYFCNIRKMLIPKILELISQDKKYMKILGEGYDIKNEKKN